MVLVGIQMGPNAGLLASVYYFCSMTLQGKVTDSGLMNRSLAYSYSREGRGVLNNLLNFSQLVIKASMSILFEWQVVCLLLGNKNMEYCGTGHGAFKGKKSFQAVERVQMLSAISCYEWGRFIHMQWTRAARLFNQAGDIQISRLQPTSGSIA